MSKTALSLALAAVLAAPFRPAAAAIPVVDPAFVYTQDFDTLATSGTANAWANDATLAGWSLFNGTGAAMSAYAADNGGSNAGAFKSFGTSGSSERALGGVGSGGSVFGSPASGAIAGWIAVAFDNATGGALSGFTLGFDGEQWRNGGNTSAQTMVLEFGLGASFGSVAQWLTPEAGFAWTSPVTGSSSAAVDGNAAGRVASVGGSVALDWAAGQTLWLRWTELNDPGNDHGLAIDNLSFSVTAVPEPGTYAMLLSGLLAIGAYVRRRG